MAIGAGISSAVDDREGDSPEKANPPGRSPSNRGSRGRITERDMNHHARINLYAVAPQRPSRRRGRFRQGDRLMATQLKVGDTPAQGLVLYEAMVSAIAECARIDEIKDIRDKAMALEMYHRQARNTEAEIEAANVRLRAERRAGELLKDLARAAPAERAEKANAVQGRSSHVAANVGPSPYAKALDDNGITRQTAHRYQALAAVPAKVFEEALAGPEKPTAVRVMARAKVREAADPVPKMSDEALWLWEYLRGFENRGYFNMSRATLFANMTDGMRGDIRRLAPLVAQFLNSLEAANEPA